MNGSYSIDSMRADDGQVSHVHPLLWFFLDDRETAHPIDIIRILRSYFLTERKTDSPLTLTYSNCKVLYNYIAENFRGFCGFEKLIHRKLYASH